MPQQAPRTTAAVEVYGSTARRLHWWTVAFVAIMVPLGFAMAYRGNDLNIWDGTTNAMYSLHKMLGFTLLWLMLARLVYRIRHGAPADEPTLEWWQKAASHATHWGLYAILILMPIGGWIGVSLYGARDIFGLVSLPPLTAVDQKASGTFFFLHKLGAFALVGLIAAHIGAAIFHHFIRKDGVLTRMLPTLKRRG